MTDLKWIRKAQHGFIYDEAAGEYVNLRTGQVLDRCEYFEVFDIFRETREAQIFAAEQFKISPLEESIEKLLYNLDDVKYHLKAGGIAIRERYPEMLIGETDLVAGAGTENRIYPYKAPVIWFDPKQTWWQIIQGMQILLIKCKQAVLNNDPETSALVQLADILDMTAQGLLPLTDTSRLLRDATSTRKLLNEVDYWHSLTSECVRRNNILEDQVKGMQNQINSLKGSLDVEVGKRRMLEEILKWQVSLPYGGLQLSVKMTELKHTTDLGEWAKFESYLNILTDKLLALRENTKDDGREDAIPPRAGNRKSKIPEDRKVGGN